jgi:cation diffusion facilitator CzcD-associated flavoprotein CzcO
VVLLLRRLVDRHGVSGLPGHTSVAILGSGFSGLGMAIRLLGEGRRDFVVLERAHDVGGTWRDNTYPGCQCDIPSHLYSFSFAPNPNWTRAFPLQQEIWDYLRDCADRFGVRPHIHFGCEVEHAAWDEDVARWRIETSRGEMTADVLIAGPGGLSEPSIPPLPGLESFEGAVFHSAMWDHDHDLDGAKVAVVGTGASAIQFVPHIQPRVERLTVFQRTPPWIMPHLDRPIPARMRRLFRRFPAAQRAFRSLVYTLLEARVVGFVREPRVLKMGERIATKHMHAQVEDPELRRRLRPAYRLGCKRVLMSDTWYPALTQPNVEVVPSGITEVRPRGVVGDDGVEHEADTIIFGTGFQVADLPIANRVRGRDGRTLNDVWEGSPRAYLATTVAGFPNLFFLTGPNSGLGHNSIVFIIEAQIAYVLGALEAMDRAGAQVLEVRDEVQAAFNERLDERMQGTVWIQGGCASWYKDRTGRVHTLWPGSTLDFWRRTRRFDEESYRLAPRPVVPEPVPA